MSTLSNVEDENIEENEEEGTIEDNQDLASFETKTIEERINVHNNDEGKKFIIETMHKSNDGKWVCNLCSYSYKHKTTVARHVECHIDGMKYDCTMCAEHFPNRVSLYQHQKIHK